MSIKSRFIVPLRAGAFASLVFIAAWLGACSDAVSPEPTNEALLLTLAPQDAAVFATWSRTAGYRSYRLEIRSAISGQWQAVYAGPLTGRLIENLANGSTYSVRIAGLRSGGGEVFSAISTVAPRQRDNCSHVRYVPWDRRVSLFCTQADAERFLGAVSLPPDQLRCRGAAVEWSAQAPNCFYRHNDQLFLLLRSADDRFQAGALPADPAAIRRSLRRAIWPVATPFERAGLLPPSVPSGSSGEPGLVTQAASAQVHAMSLGNGLNSRIARFSPHSPVARRYAIYAEGHGGAGVQIGAETIDWLLMRGWTVYVVDMPLSGTNAVDVQSSGMGSHWDLDRLDNGTTSPLSYFFLPVLRTVEMIYAASAGDPDLLLIGRSGGGWTAYMYGALDDRIDAVVSVAGGRPLSQRLDATWIPIPPLEVGDYEQAVPHVYDQVSHEAAMAIAGRRGGLFIYNQYDLCCFRIAEGDPFVQYLVSGAAGFGKPARVYVEPGASHHGIGPGGYSQLERFLSELFP